MPTVLITGGTGTIGKRLSQLLADKGYEIIILTRNPVKQKKTTTKVSFAGWDINKGTIDEAAVQQADYIINLAGAGVAEKRWTAERKREIIDSRTQSCALLVQSLTNIPNKVKAVVSASATGYYGEDNLLSLNDGFTEDDKPSDDFLGKTCRLWEEAIEPVAALGKRLVILRTGIVLSNEGGAYVEFKKPLHFGIATILGNGKQIISWIHTEDICRQYLFALENEQLSGIYNAVAPEPVSNKELILAIAKARKKFFLPVQAPKFALKLALGEMSTEVLKSANVSAARIENAGFHFTYRKIEDAVKNLLAEKTKV